MRTEAGSGLARRELMKRGHEEEPRLAEVRTGHGVFPHDAHGIGTLHLWRKQSWS